MSRSALAGVFIGLTAIAGLSSAPGGAGDCCDCYPSYGYSAYYAPPVRAYYYQPRVAYYRFDPRWQYEAAYYNPSPRIYGYGYAYMPPAPAYLVREPGWRRRW